MPRHQLKYYSGSSELQSVGWMPLSQLKIQWPSSKPIARAQLALVGKTSAGEQKPVTRYVEYKTDNPSRHRCDGRCMNATGHLCECSCGGKNHGILNG